MTEPTSSYLSAVSRSVRDLLAGRRGTVLIAVAGGWFLTMGVRMIYPVMVPYLQSAYDLDLTTAGLLLTVLFMAYAIGQLPGGVLADRIGERLILTSSMLISAITLVLVITAGSAIVLFVATALFGFGAALYAVGRYTILPQLYPEQIGAANGLTASSQDAGQSVLPPLAGIIAAGLVWQLGFGFAVPLFLAMAAVLWVVTPKRSADDADDAEALSLSGLRYIASILRQPAIVYPTTVLVLGLFIWQAFTGFYPTYLVQEKGLSEPLSSGLFGLFFALGIVIKPLSGSAYDRIGARRSLLFVTSGPIVAFLALPFFDNFWVLIVVTAFVSTLLGFATVTEPFLLEHLPEDIRGTGFGILRTVGFSVGALGPVFFGAAADNGFFDEAFMALAAFAGAMMLLGSRIPTE
ncbi:MFS transporter [Natronorubrum daqingense]|uniref:MFS transporter n=1 Tax=Natronorubrum daqingense TaxID=588898 RepID=A0A1N7ESY5_9EURY|nr:MFS transporter [Natronorubrum daqingense]APX97731.1 MFS transporter [Natronorubrum daqingense]SIR91238.1 Nitrate/nitrite transporter NarK [Natronorubrum daqingense]